MFHKIVPPVLRTSIPDPTPKQNPAGLALVRTPASRPSTAPTPAGLDLLIIAARRCSSFFAEAAVLVLVFGLLDFLMLKGRLAFSRTDLSWIVGALALSLVLLAASIATDFSAQRWMKAHP